MKANIRSQYFFLKKKGKKDGSKSNDAFLLATQILRQQHSLTVNAKQPFLWTSL
jgi:hypothetical protein